MKILISAYACEPGTGSEPGSGWNWVRQIARFEECWVITRCNNRESIERAAATNAMRKAHFVYYDLPAPARFWKKGSRGARAYYHLWQIGAYRLARRLHREIQFDLVHHLTFASYCLPSFLSLIPVPFVWGPLGGGESAPRNFLQSYSLRGKAYEILRNAARSIAEVNPFVRMTARRAAASLAVTPQTADRLKTLGCREVSLSTQVALSIEERSLLAALPLPQSDTFRVLSIGRLLHWKGFELGIRAFAQFRRAYPESEYWLIGEGPEQERWKRLASSLGIANRMLFWNRLPRLEVLRKIAECNVLLHPSLHDSGGWVTAEAMAVGRPVICLDLGGPGLQVTDKTGIKIPALTPEQVIADIALALKQIANDSQGRVRMGAEARARIERDYNSERLGAELTTLYARLVRA